MERKSQNGPRHVLILASVNKLWEFDCLVKVMFNSDLRLSYYSIATTSIGRLFDTLSQRRVGNFFPRVVRSNQNFRTSVTGRLAEAMDRSI